MDKEGATLKNGEGSKFLDKRSTPFMEIDDKGGEIGTKYVNASRGEVVVGHGQRGSSIE